CKRLTTKLSLTQQVFTNETDSHEEIYISGEKDTRSLAQLIWNKIKNDKEALVFININLLIGSEYRQNQKGIELLIWLRIKGLMNHCVLYSFESLHAILNRNPGSLIATSKGTTFVHLPTDFNNFKLRELSLKL